MFHGRMFFERDCEFSIVLRSCKLFEQFLCDMWCKIESEKLS